MVSPKVIAWGTFCIYLEAVVGWAAGANHDAESVAFFLWMLHFARRIFETFSTFRYSRGGISSHQPAWNWATFFGALVFYFFGGFFIGWASSDAEWSLARFPGVLVFIVGEIGNGYHHLLLGRHDRLGGSLPDGGLFHVFHKPHYFFEVISWLGMFLAFPNVATAGFLFASIGGMSSQILMNPTLVKRATWWMLPGF